MGLVVHLNVGRFQFIAASLLYASVCMPSTARAQDRGVNPGSSFSEENDLDWSERDTLSRERAGSSFEERSADENKYLRRRLPDGRREPVIVENNNIIVVPPDPPQGAAVGGSGPAVSGAVQPSEPQQAVPPPALGRNLRITPTPISATTASTETAGTDDGSTEVIFGGVTGATPALEQ